jgi:CRISPR-associated protein Cas1
MSAGLAQVASLDLLRSSWETVLANDREDGVLGVGVARFARDADSRLQEIAVELAAGRYRPGLLVRVGIARDDGAVRLLHVPKVRDRVVERAILAALTPVIDPWLGPWSLAYRPGLGVSDAVQELVRLREQGLGWGCARGRGGLLSERSDGSLAAADQRVRRRRGSPGAGRGVPGSSVDRGGRCSRGVRPAAGLAVVALVVEPGAGKAGRAAGRRRVPGGALLRRLRGVGGEQGRRVGGDAGGQRRSSLVEEVSCWLARQAAAAAGPLLLGLLAPQEVALGLGISAGSDGQAGSCRWPKRLAPVVHGRVGERAALVVPRLELGAAATVAGRG